MNEDGKKARGAIAVILGLAFVAICVLMIFFEPKASTEKYLVLLVGSLITLVTMVVQFYFGSSSGAKQLVANQQEVAATLAKKLGDGPGEASDFAAYKVLHRTRHPDSTDEQVAAAFEAWQKRQPAKP
jgi:hypothetical protein